MPTLLGHLSQFGSFSLQGEVLCTQGLAYLLRHRDIRSLFGDGIREHTGLEIAHDLDWRAEAYQEKDGGRPDLQATDPEGVPVVKIEAKLGAGLSPGQLRSYLDDLQGRGPDRVLLVLIPRQRLTEANQVVSTTLGSSGVGCWQCEDYPDVRIATITWEDVFVALQKVRSERVRFEAEQLSDMYEVLSGYYIAPIAGVEELAAWRERESDFISLVDRATRRLTAYHNVYPLGLEQAEQPEMGLDLKGYRRRYVCRPLDGHESCYSVGVRDPFASHTTPLWLRFLSNTPGFRMIAGRLKASGGKQQLVLSGGHIWVPLNPPFQTNDEAMVDVLVGQVEEVIKVAYGEQE